jgi:hypothetical protein
MSATATTINFKQLLIDRVREISKIYVTDFGFIPEDRQTVSPMGKARNPVDFTAECAGFNLWVARIFTGESSDTGQEERKAYLASLTTGAKALDALNESVLALTAAIAATPDDDLGREISMPWGAPAKLHEAASMAAGHMMYHLGQINYIQSLYGDDQNHWG